MSQPRLFASPDGRSYAVTFGLVSSLFLLWGFCNGMIDVMDKHFQEELHLSLAQSAWVQFAHYLGYFLMALPAGWFAARLGYKGGIIFGLLLVAAGGFWFIPATHIAAFWAFLLGVCLIASGLTFLETIANPYTTVLGPKEFAATRINMAQSCNGVGWMMGPIAGAYFFYSKNEAGQSTGSAMLWIPYAGVAVVVIFLAVLFFFARVPDVQTKDEYHADGEGTGTGRSVWSHPHFVMAVVAQFFYVAAQAGIFAFFINYLTSQTPPIPASWNNGWLKGWFEAHAGGDWALSNRGSANLASVGFFCFLLGRMSGAVLLRRAAPQRVLALYGVINVILCGLIFCKLGWCSVACVFLSYFFMSIMFPTIFALGIYGLGSRAKQASSFIVMAIMGGAILPKLMGYVADKSDVSRSFAVPLVCFAVVAWYGFGWSKWSGAESAAVNLDRRH